MGWKTPTASRYNTGDYKSLRRMNVVGGVMNHASIIACLAVLATLISANPLAAQPQPQQEGAEWYDTLTVTKPRYAQMTDSERFLLSLYTAATLPSLIVVGGLATVPPSVSAMQEDGVWRTGVGLSAGIGFGGDRRSLWWFHDARLQAEGTWYFHRDRPLLLRAALLFDYRVASISRNNLYWVGVAGGAGASTDFAATSPFAEGWIGVMNPNGVRFTGLFPMHNFGLRGRVGYDIANERSWIELALGGTATF